MSLRGHTVIIAKLLGIVEFMVWLSRAVLDTYRMPHININQINHAIFHKPSQSADAIARAIRPVGRYGQSKTECSSSAEDFDELASQKEEDAIDETNVVMSH